jgi:hypothetical protein
MNVPLWPIRIGHAKTLNNGHKRKGQFAIENNEKEQGSS